MILIKIKEMTPFKKALIQFQKQYIKKHLKLLKNKPSLVADALKMSRATIWKRMNNKK